MTANVSIDDVTTAIESKITDLLDSIVEQTTAAVPDSGALSYAKGVEAPAECVVAAWEAGRDAALKALENAVKKASGY